MDIHSIYDNGGETADRFTVYFKGRGSLFPDGKGNTFRYAVAMSEHPFHPQGVGMHTSGTPGRHNGRRISFEALPEDCKKLVLQEL